MAGGSRSFPLEPGRALTIDRAGGVGRTAPDLSASGWSCAPTPRTSWSIFVYECPAHGRAFAWQVVW